MQKPQAQQGFGREMVVWVVTRCTYHRSWRL